MPKSIGEDSQLYDESANKERQSHCIERVLVQECHQEAEADENHHVDVLKHRVVEVHTACIGRGLDIVFVACAECKAHKESQLDDAHDGAEGVGW